MESFRKLDYIVSLSLLAVVVIMPTGSRAAIHETVLHSFDALDGLQPFASLVMDEKGNLYGTTEYGGPSDYGTVFELSPQGDGTWSEKLLHTFNLSDGEYPQANLTFDPAGNLYGTTSAGDKFSSGNVFELSPGIGGDWSFRVLHTFDIDDGESPQGGLIFDGSGNLYGTTFVGGANRYGTVFRLSPMSNGQWNETVLHSFDGQDGLDPVGNLIIHNRRLYGVTYEGGTLGYGTVYSVACDLAAKCKETVLYNFQAGIDGSHPYGGLVADQAGNLYGTTTGPPYRDGNVFELSPARDGQWMESVLHSFAGMDGSDPMGSLIFDPKGNLYGTTAAALEGYGTGVVFQLTHGSNGLWTETILHRFEGPDGSTPFAGLLFDRVGNLYGTTFIGGDPKVCSGQGCGVVFRITH